MTLPGNDRIFFARPFDIALHVERLSGAPHPIHQLFGHEPISPHFFIASSHATKQLFRDPRRAGRRAAVGSPRSRATGRSQLTPHPAEPENACRSLASCPGGGHARAQVSSSRKLSLFNHQKSERSGTGAALFFVRGQRAQVRTCSQGCSGSRTSQSDQSCAPARQALLLHMWSPHIDSRARHRSSTAST